MYMNFSVFNFFFSLYFMGVMSLCFNRFHLLMLLLSLEFIVLVLYSSLIFYLNLFEVKLFFSVLFLSLKVCEGVLGLSILIHMVRMNGNDYFQVLNIL
uniref:NADH dehydrogenase subunit 4L n=1 Tax=Monocellicampa pruni TaxID=1322158 RepID=K4LLV9_9HYME|nr:NADH dehydrogenase subunit 4L [Monocellicampa pruni]